MVSPRADVIACNAFMPDHIWTKARRVLYKYAPFRAGAGSGAAIVHDTINKRGFTGWIRRSRDEYFFAGLINRR
jgi:hypothetical protein